MNNLGTVTLETERLILRKFKIEDAENMYNNWASDPEVCKYLSWNYHKDVEETKEIVKMWINNYENNFYQWVVELKETHEIIGSIGAVNVREKDLNVEIGYCYGKKYWNKGYGSEALKKIIEFFIKECGCHLVEAMYMSDNPASGKVMEKVGMTKETSLRDRIVNKETDKLNDLIVYSITKNELK